MAKKVKASKMGHRASEEEGARKRLVPIAWAWERGVKVGCGRRPDAFIYSEEDVKQFDPKDFIVIRANSQWVGSAGTQQASRR